ncbi:lysoplasmalogenase [Parvularcula sp. ZS-1/3]|uniref:Lysoplasmalogenase n=1 Tax=Parvularcula mediterranea TaxID=2732508 RepID=A0A7Y3RKU2_9PROT|nr:lysoplasmalogenase [Parvularcula mediterranea]NNU15928.1 lysoplasmalogenase [Parvularcula mediterranea]
MGFEMIWPSLVCMTFAVGLVWAEYRGKRREQWLFKPMAAAFFIIQAGMIGPFGEPYGRFIFAGLILSALGDLLLLPRDKSLALKAGMLAFGLAHVAYICGFIWFPIYDLSPLTVVGAVITFALVTGVWLWAHFRFPGEHELSVMLYAPVIGTMVASAFHVADRALPIWIVAAALMFAVSDLFVARDRFVVREPRNNLIITPLYFGAQCLFALSIAAAGPGGAG